MDFKNGALLYKWTNKNRALLYRWIIKNRALLYKWRITWNYVDSPFKGQCTRISFLLMLSREERKMEMLPRVSASVSRNT